MKKCTRFHFEDVEPGDVLFLSGGSTQEFNEVPDPDIQVVVASAYTSHNFGPVVKSKAGVEYYLSDYDNVEHVADAGHSDDFPVLTEGEIAVLRQIAYKASQSVDIDLSEYVEADD